MIVWHGENPSEIHWMGKNIIEVHAANKEVWTLFLSCFGRGYWIDELPWSDVDVWKD